MQSLQEMKCEPCRAGTPKATDAEIAEYLEQLNGWAVVAGNGIKRLERVFPFADFTEALTFTNAVGELAESQGHHPALLTEWGRVRVAWWTHKIGGLHRTDFIMAAKTDQLYRG